MSPVETTDLPLPLLKRGKVRDMYDLDQHVLMVASDRISAFDCVLPDPIPDKGRVLTQISRYWFERTTHVVQNHLVTSDPGRIASRVPELDGLEERWAGRSMLVRKATPFAVECVVRGYLAGSGWREYTETGRVTGIELPPGLEECAELPEPVFTPAVKAEEGHDENIPFEAVEDRLGVKLAHHLRDRSLALYGYGRQRAAGRGLLVADTKFEFGFTDTGEILLIDEVLTPDSSRLWPADEYRPGGAQPSLDKQPVRDWLQERADAGEWNKEPPAPTLPPEVVEATTRRYREAYRRLTGRELE